MANNNQGEVSLLDMMNNMKPSDATATLERPSSSMSIALDEEKRRRQEAEKFIQQLQAQVYELQQDKVIAEAAIQRKDSVLLQAQQQWKTFEADWKRKLQQLEEEKLNHTSIVKRLEEQVEASAADSRKVIQETQVMARKSEEAVRTLQAANSRLTDSNELLQSQLQEINRRYDESGKEAAKMANQVEELKRENHRMKNLIEDMKREKHNLNVELELSQERYETSRQQWESHCQNRIQETAQQSELEADRKLKIWQTEVESKLVHLVKTLEQQLGFLKAKSLEETQSLQTRHQAEVSKLRALIQQQKKEYDDMTSHMRELAEAQWNTVNRVHPAGARAVVHNNNNGISDTASLVSNSTSVKTSATQTAAKREEIQQYVSQVIKRHNGMPSSSQQQQQQKKT